MKMYRMDISNNISNFDDRFHQHPNEKMEQIHAGHVNTIRAIELTNMPLDQTTMILWEKKLK